MDVPQSIMSFSHKRNCLSCESKDDNKYNPYYAGGYSRNIKQSFVRVIFRFSVCDDCASKNHKITQTLKHLYGIDNFDLRACDAQ